MTQDTQFPAQDFSLPSDTGETVSLAGLKGQAFVLFFYPRDNTPGCTTEAKGFSADMSAFEAAGARVFGVSKDSLESHGKFRAKQDLTVPLLSDEHGSLCEDLDVWKEKKMYGKSFMGVERSTFLIDGA